MRWFETSTPRASSKTFWRKLTSLRTLLRVQYVDVPGRRGFGYVGAIERISAGLMETGFLGKFPKSDCEVSRYDLLRFPI